VHPGRVCDGGLLRIPGSCRPRHARVSALPMNLSFPELDSRLQWALVAPSEAADQLRMRPEEWLAPAEQVVLAALRVEGRRRAWCSGRLAAKRAVKQWLLDARGRDAG